MDFLTLIPQFDAAAIAASYGPWAAFAYLTACKAAAVYCNNTETKDTWQYKLAEWLADNEKKAKL